MITLLNKIIANLQSISFLVLSIGVLINAVVIPPYDGSSRLCDDKDIWKFNLRICFGWFANMLIIIGVLGQIYSLFALR